MALCIICDEYFFMILHTYIHICMYKYMIMTRKCLRIEYEENKNKSNYHENMICKKKFDE